MKGFLFFDLDGVILNSMPYHAKAWISAFREFGLEFTKEEIYLYEGAIELETAKDLFKKKGIEPTSEFFHKAFELQKKIFKKYYSKEVKPFSEVPSLLSELKKEKRILALVTSSSQEILNKVLPKDLSKFFDLILTGDKVEKRKPHPDPYLKAKEFFRAQEEEVLVIENSPAGVQAAKSAGCFCIGITTTLKPEHLKLADLIVKNHKELRDFLLNGQINGQRTLL